MNDEKVTISAEYYVKSENGIYFKSRYYSGTFFYDNKSRKTKLIECKNSGKLDYMFSIDYKNYVIFPPFFSKDFLIVNKVDNSVSYVPNIISDIYTGYTIWKQKIYLFTMRTRTIVSLSFDSEFKFEKLTLDGDKNAEITSRFNQIEFGNNVIHTIKKEDVLGIYDKENMSYEYINVGLDGMIPYTINYANGKYLITGDKPWIMISDCGLEGRYRKFYLEDFYKREKTIGWNYYFSRGVVLENRVLLAPVNYKAVISVDMSDETIQYSNCLDVDEYSWGIYNWDYDRAYLSCVKQEKNTRNLILDEMGNVIEENVFQLSGKEFISANNLTDERKGFTLKNYIQSL